MKIDDGFYSFLKSWLESYLKLVISVTLMPDKALGALFDDFGLG